MTMIKIGSVILALLFLSTMALAETEVVGDDYESEWCLVRTFGDLFTDMLHSVMLFCDDDEYEREAAFRMDYYFGVNRIEVTVFDYDLEQEDDTLLSIDIRVDGYRAMTFAARWNSGKLENAAKTTLSTEHSAMILAQLMDNPTKLMYRVSGRKSLHVPLDTNMIITVSEFAKRIHGESVWQSLRKLIVGHDVLSTQEG